MKLATTLVHKSAMMIARHAVRSFAACFSDRYHLEIHTDGSLDDDDHRILLHAAGTMDAKIVTPSDRRSVLEIKLSGYPRTSGLLANGGYFTKLELPITVPKPYFYFDSDIVWLRPPDRLEPMHCPNAFSTETWSWYYGLQHAHRWVGEKVPRRVNSGFYHVSEDFPHARMEELLANDMFSASRPGNSDQEIMAYLFKNTEMYHPSDLMRSRVGVMYNISTLDAAAIHFPGRMWINHMSQIESFEPGRGQGQKTLRFQPAIPLSYSEIGRMRMFQMLEDSVWARLPIRTYRNLRKRIRSRQ